MSYNNIKIDSTSKIAESGGHEHVMLSFFVQGSEHSLLTQQENEGLVYQIWLFQIWSLRNHTHREEMSLRNIENQSILHQTLYLQGKKNKIEIYATSVTLQTIRDYMNLLQFMLQKK